MSGTDLLDAPAREVATAPPRVWRNKMQAKENIILADYTYKAGEFFQAGPEFSSKDAAEAAAYDFLCGALDPPRDDEILAKVVDYIGAIPSGDA